MTWPPGNRRVRILPGAVRSHPGFQRLQDLRMKSYWSGGVGGSAWESLDLAVPLQHSIMHHYKPAGNWPGARTPANDNVGYSDVPVNSLFGQN